jgi:hypothetical protein
MEPFDLAAWVRESAVASGVAERLDDEDVIRQIAEILMTVQCAHGLYTQGPRRPGVVAPSKNGRRDAAS